MARQGPGFQACLVYDDQLAAQYPLALTILAQTPPRPVIELAAGECTRVSRDAVGGAKNISRSAHAEVSVSIDGTVTVTAVKGGTLHVNEEGTALPSSVARHLVHGDVLWLLVDSHRPMRRLFPYRLAVCQDNTAHTPSVQLATEVPNKRSSWAENVRLSSLAGVGTAGCLAPDGTVFHWGQVSQSDRPRISRVPRRLLFPSDAARITQVSMGNHYAVFLAADDTVFGRGSNQFCQLGLPPSVSSTEDALVEIPLPWPAVRPQPPAIRMVAAGIGGSLAIVLHAGTVLTCGQLSGHSEPQPDGRLRSLDHGIFNNARVMYASIGGCLNLFITEDGGCYTHGYNSNAESTTILGHGGENEMEEHRIVVPRLIASMYEAGIKAVSGSAGRMHGAIVDVKGKVWTWGANRRGQLGFPDTSKDRSAPQWLRLPEESEASMVSCGWYHSLVQCTDGRVVSYGACGTGQLGRPTTDESISPPDFVELGHTVGGTAHRATALAAGDYFSVVVACNMAPDANAGFDYDVLTFGAAATGQLGNDTALTVGPFQQPYRSVPHSVLLDPAQADGPHINDSDLQLEAESKEVTAASEEASSRPQRKRKHTQESRPSRGSRSNILGQAEHEEEDQDRKSILIDFSDASMDMSGFENTGLPTFEILETRVRSSTDFLEAPTASFELIIANAYCPCSLRPLSSALRGLRDHILGLTFVSCSFCERDLPALLVALSQCSLLDTFVLELTSIGPAVAESEEAAQSDDSLSRLCVHVARMPSIQTLSVSASGVGDLTATALARCLRDTVAPCTMTSLSLAQCCDRLTLDGVRQLSEALSHNTVLEHFSIAQSHTICNAVAETVAKSLVHNTTLTSLDLHVNELGHTGVQSDGVLALTQSLESNHKSQLCVLDVSGDDGSPEVPQDVQKRLTSCLMRHAAAHGVESAASKPVWHCHERDDY